MRIFREYIPEGLEYSYVERSTENGSYYLEDIMTNHETDIGISYQKPVSKNISYEFGNIIINGIIKSKLNTFFINPPHNEGFYNFNAVLSDQENTFEIVITERTLYTLKADIILNGTVVETLDTTDGYGLSNYTTIVLDSSGLGTGVSFINPAHMTVGESVEYTQYFIYPTVNKDNMNKFTCFYDDLNNNLLFERSYDSSLFFSVISKGNMLRSNTINELRKQISSSLVMFEEESNKVYIPEKFLFPQGTVLRIIKEQELTLDPLSTPANYSLIGIYLKDDNLIYPEVILNKTTYGDIISELDLFMLGEDRSYFMYLIVFNNLSTFNYLDLFLLGANLGSGGQGLNKLMTDVTSATSLQVSYAGGTTAPMIQIYDDQGLQVIPEEVSYNFSDTVDITFGELFSGKVAII